MGCVAPGGNKILENNYMNLPRKSTKNKKDGENVLTENGRWKSAGTLFCLAAQQEMKEAARGQGKENM